MKLSDLQDKDVISVIDGIKIGNIIDIKITLTGEIEYLVLEKKSNKFFSSGEEINVKWSQIKKIGEDVILVES